MIKIKFQVSKTYFQVSWEENLVFLFANFEKKGFYCSCCIAFTTELIEACVNTKYKLLDTASLQITARRGLLGGQRSCIGWRIIQLTKALLVHCERQEGLRLGEGLAFRPLAPINIPQYFMPAPSVDPGVLFSFPLSSPCWFFCPSVVCENHVYLLKCRFHTYHFSNILGEFHYCLVHLPLSLGLLLCLPFSIY